MNRHPVLGRVPTRGEISRLTALCLAFVAIDQLNDPLLDASLWQETSYWLARVLALTAGLFGAAFLVSGMAADRFTRPAWLRPLILVTVPGILPLVTVEVFMEPHLPLRPEFADDELRARSPALAFLAEYVTVATIVLPIHLLLWLLLPGRTPDGSIEAPATAEIGRETPEFLRRAGVSSPDQVIALKAEEHYINVYTADAHRLVHHRFSKAVLEMPVDLGLQVHRSWWVADAAVTSAKRGSRRWQLMLANEISVPISDSYVRSVRERGLLNRASVG
ncbi:MAG: LytTR family DNA-binding domain-containing protein [Pseudomonadota bacterium]